MQSQPTINRTPARNASRRRFGGRRFGGRRFGGATLEAALVVPFILLPLAFGTGEYGYYFFLKHTLQGAAREGARAGITPTATNADVTTAVTNYMTVAGLQGSGYTTAIQNTSGGTINVSGYAAGSAIVVKVQCTWGTAGIRVLPTAMGGISSGKVVVGQTVMRKEG
jgi:Flp pilus assembly protein TadG